MINKNKPYIIVDSREKRSFSFAEDDIFAGYKVQKLECGDYSIEGLESLILIERKQSVSEIAQNVTESRWPKYLQRASGYPAAFMVCEFSIDDVLGFPYNADLPASVIKNIRITGNFLWACIVEWMTTYNIKVLFCNNKETAEKTTHLILKRMLKKYANSK